MEELLEKLDSYRKEIIGTEIIDAETAETYRIRFLGTKGIVKNLFQEMKNVPAEKKKEFGQILNEFKQLAESKYDGAKPNAERLTPNASQMDWSLPGDPITDEASHIAGKKQNYSNIRETGIFRCGRTGDRRRLA
jgi:phenylalanyl-tRNA synthetase alpha chain